MPCRCLRTPGALRGGSAPAALQGSAQEEEPSTGFFTGETRELFFKKQSKYSPTKTEVGKRDPFTTECFTFAVISSCSPPPTSPPFSLCHFQQSSSPTRPCRTGSPQPHRLTAPAHHGPCGSPHHLTAPSHRTGSQPAGSAPLPRRQAQRQRRGTARDGGAVPPPAERRDAPLLGRLFASDPSAPRRGIYKATFFSSLTQMHLETQGLYCHFIWRLTHFQQVSPRDFP